MESRFIQFKDSTEITIDISDITAFFYGKTGGTNVSFNICFLFKSGADFTVAYDLEDEENYLEDVEYLNSLISKR